MSTPKIYLIHATPLAIAPVAAAFKAQWPEAKLRNLLEDGLSADVADHTAKASAMGPRMLELAEYAVAQGADAILFTCSAFAGPIDEVKARYENMPVLNPNEAMFREAINHCEGLGGERRIGILTTFAPALVSLSDELTAMIGSRAISVCGQNADGAFEDLNQGKAELHDQKILAAVANMPKCDVYLLGQFSMARAQIALAGLVNAPVLTSPGSAVKVLQSKLKLG